MIVAVDWHYWAPVGISTGVNIAVFLATIGMLLLTRRTVDQQKEWIKYQGTANLTAAAVYGGLGLPDDRLIEITNAGPAVARSPMAWLVGEDGTLATQSKYPIGGIALSSGGEPVSIVFEVCVPDQELRLFASWRDGNGNHFAEEIHCLGLNAELHAK